MTNSYKMLSPTANGTSTTKLIAGIPFSLTEEGEGYKNLVSGSYPFHAAPSLLHFLGMVTDFPEGSDRWGMSDRLYAFQYRIFIGDRLGRIMVRYADHTQENVPVIFGVNVWPYEMYWGVGDGDAKTTVKGGAIEAGPYTEPFGSDPAAARLLEESLRTTPAGDTKQTKYIFTLDVGGRPIIGIDLIDEKNKMAGFLVSAITALEAGDAAGSGSLKITDYGYFYSQRHIPPMRALAHRLYQYKEDIGAGIGICRPDGFDGPDIRFEGDAFADIMTNVYYANLQDMAQNKIDEDGSLHTSTLEAPTFGRYIGFGTFKEKDGAYYHQIWGRDAGRHLIELVRFGKDQRAAAAADKLFAYLYDKSLKFQTPNWKRVVNGSLVAVAQQLTNWSGRENDGHGLIMIFLSGYIRSHRLDRSSIQTDWHHFIAAAQWYLWQMDHPEQSNFNGVFYSDSEPAGGGGYDLYSNYIAYTALSEFAGIARLMEEEEWAAKWSSAAERLFGGIHSRFIIDGKERGMLLADPYTGFDSWSFGFKIFAPLMMESDCRTYDIYDGNRALFDLSLRTYREMTKEYKSNAYGRMMGYGQAFAFQTALLLDEYQDFTALAESTAMLCYHAHDHNYIVPEGVIMHPSGRCWYRNGDLGNAVQQAEIIKCIRIMAGLDDFDPERGVIVIPRLPDSWNRMEASGYPVLVSCTEPDAGSFRTTADFCYSRIAGGYHIRLDAKDPIRFKTIRVGPFDPERGHLTVSDPRYSITRTECIGTRLFAYIGLPHETAKGFSFSVTGCENLE